MDVFSDTILTVICISNTQAPLEQIVSVIMVSACKTSPKPAYPTAVKLSSLSEVDLYLYSLVFNQFE